MRPPIGMVNDGAILYGELPNVFLTTGIELLIPALSDLPDESKNDFWMRIESIFASASSSLVIQIKTTVDGDYNAPLNHYHNDKSYGSFDQFVRDSIEYRFRNAMDHGMLWKKRVFIFAGEYLKLNGSRKQISSSLRASSLKAKAFLKSFENNLKTFGGGIKELRNEDLKELIATALHTTKNNLESRRIKDDDVVKSFYDSDTVGLEDGVFMHGGLYHRTLTIKEMPDSSFPGMSDIYLNQSHRDYDISMLCKSVEKQTMIDRYERELGILRVEQSKNNSVSQERDIQNLEYAITQLKDNSGGIYQTIMFMRIWADTLETLQTRCEEARNRFSELSALSLYEPSLAPEAFRFFYASLPGYPGDMMQGYDNEIEPSLVSRMLPLASQFRGDLNEPQALYQGLGNSLVGFSLFAGGSPRHLLIVGSSGSGKSAFTNDLLLQVYGQTDRTLIVETGNSYGMTVQLLGGTTLKFDLGGSLKINIFDTHGAPLSPSDLSMITNILLAMRQDEVSEIEKSILAEAVRKFLVSKLKSFLNNEHIDLRGEALAFKQFLSSHDGDVKAIYADFKKEVENGNISISFPEDELLDFIQNEENLEFYHEYCFKEMRPEQFPILEEFRDYCKFFAHEKDEEKLLKTLGRLLEPWCGGTNGRLLNGHTNFSLSGRLVQIELGGLGENNAVKSVLLALIRGLAYQNALNAPRIEKKVFIFEELGALSREMNGLSEIVKTIAQTGRKYNIQMTNVVQQYDTFKSSPSLMKTIIGNTNQYAIFKQKTKDDLEDLLDQTGLPKSLAQTIMDYPIPADISDPADRHSKICFACPSTRGWNVGTMLVFCSPAVIYTADSGGENYDKKEELIKRVGIDRIRTELIQGRNPDEL